MKVKEITASQTINVNGKPYWQYNIKIEEADGHIRTESSFAVFESEEEAIKAGEQYVKIYNRRIIK